MAQPCWMDWRDRVQEQKYFMLWPRLLLVEMWNFGDWIQFLQGLSWSLRKCFEAFKTFLLKPLLDQQRLSQRSTSSVVNSDHSSHLNHCLDFLLCFSFSFLMSIFYHPWLVFSAYIQEEHRDNTTLLRLNKGATWEEGPLVHQVLACVPHSNEHGSIARLVGHIWTYLLTFYCSSRLICNLVDWKESQQAYESKDNPGNIHNSPSFHLRRCMDNAPGHKRKDEVVF